ncbi:MAG: MFS transporter [Solirubrobacterales bacterium]
MILSAENRKWWTVAALSVALFMIMIDNTVVNVALPSIQRDLDVDLSALEWVANAYTLMFAVFLLTGGKLGDYFGRKRVFIIGLVTFTAASLLCGLATTGGWLVAGRAIQGLGAALMLPASLAIINASFEPRQRGMAIGIWVGVAASALAIGPLIGGLFTDTIGWSWIFFVNVPIGVAGIFAAVWLIDESRDESAEQRLDVRGLVLSGVALFALTYALVEANGLGWSSATILALLAVAVVGLVAFVLVELRQRSPMLDVRLFRNRTFAGATTVAVIQTFSMFGMFLFIAIYMQRVLGFSALATGAAVLPQTVLIMFLAPTAGRLADRFGSRWLITTGLTLNGIALLLLSGLDAGSNFFDMMPAFVLSGFGMGMITTPMTSAALSAVPVDKSGVGSGVLTTARQLGIALGIAVMGAIIAAHTGEVAGGTGSPQAFVDGFTTALVVGACASFAGALIAATTIRPAAYPPEVSLPEHYGDGADGGFEAMPAGSVTR